MNNPLVYQAIGVLLVLFFIFLLVMCWKTWRFTHVFFSFLVFAAAVTFLLFASMVLKTHAAWRSHYEAHVVALEKVRQENEKLLHGDLDELEQSEDSIRSLRAELAMAVVDRGRVWRECRPVQQLTPNSFRVNTVPASLPPNAEPAPSGIAPKTVLYVFAEKETESGYRVPSLYMGEFSVTDATESEVTIEATLPLDAEQQQALAQGNTTWALYEVMPLDSHEAFAEMDQTEKRLVGMDKQALAEYLPNRYGWPQDEYNRFLERFERFNREATEQDPPQNVWTLVEFVKTHEIQVDSDVEQTLLEDGGRFFDASGRALEGRVRRGEEGTVKFAAGDTAAFDKETADKLVADGVAKQVKQLYRRSLNDFALAYRDGYYHDMDLNVEIQRAKRDADIMVALKVKAEEQLAFRQQENANLEKDLAGFKRELQQVTAYHQALVTRWEQTRARLSELFRANAQMVDELTRLQIDLAREIDQRTGGSSAAAVPTSAGR